MTQSLDSAKKSNFVFASVWPLRIALAAALILVASINVLWWRLDEQATNQANLVDHTHQVIAALEETLARADDMVLGQRGFALTHEVGFLEPYFNATNRMPALIHSLEELTRDNAKQTANLASLEPSLAGYEQFNREHIEELAKGNPLAPDLEFRRKIRDSTAVIHALVGQMVSEENNLLAQRQKSSKRATRVVTYVNAIAGLVSMALLAAVFGALWRENARRRESEKELQLSHGELESRVRQRTQSLLQSESERKRLEQEILETSDKEMDRIGQDLHDGVGQQLTALSLFATSLQKEAEEQAPQLAEACQKIGVELRELVRQIRVLSHGLSPVSLEENGLVEALRKLADDMQVAAAVHCRFEDSSEIPFTDSHVALQLYRIGQEAITNAVKHSGADEVCISLKATHAKTELRVADNGRGFSAPVQGKTGLGLRAMKYRADVIGASIEIDSTPGKGTRIHCVIQK
jgi:signal transduction histidine kinase